MIGLIGMLASVSLAHAPAAAPAAIRTCADAPAGSALAATGHFAERAGAGLDVSEDACAPTTARPPVTAEGIPTAITDGLQLRAIPGPPGATVPRGTQATAALGGGGAAITSYSASFRAFRAAPGWELRLTASGPAGAVVLWSGTGAFSRRIFPLPGDTRKLTWSLACRQATCSVAATGDASERGLPATLNVYGSTATLSAPG